MLGFLSSSLSTEIGIDLGTANTLVYLRGRGVIIREPSVVVMHKKSRAVLAVGEAAKRMLGKTPDSILAIRPLRGGVISDFEATEKMLRFFIGKVHRLPSRFPRLGRCRVVIGIPSGITEVERRAVKDAALRAGAGEVSLVEEPVAGAIGAGLPVQDPEGSLIVDIGGGTTEIAILSLGGVVVGKSLKVAGDRMNEAIADYAREKYNLLLGEQTAERVKLEVGNAYGSEDSQESVDTGVMRGRDLVTGLPKSVVLGPREAREALRRPLFAIVDAVRAVIESAPPELLSDILGRGMTLVGGGALLRGIDQLLAEKTEVPVRIAEDPMTCVVRGCGKVLEDRGLLERVTVGR